MADRLGWNKREARATLKRLHTKHGGLIFRETDQPNGKIWIDSARLAVVWPDRFGAAPPTAANVAALLGRVEAAEEKAARASAEVATLRQEVQDLRRR